MKYFRSFLLALFTLSILASCKTNTDLNSSSWIQKRRYTKGFHVDLKKNHKHEREGKTSVYQMEPANSLEGEMIASKEIQPELAVGDRASFAIPESTKQKKAKKVSQTVSPGMVTNNSFYDPSDQFVAPLPFSPAPPAAPNSDLNFWLILILTILIPPLGIGLVFGIEKEFWISLVLTLLFYFPGLIYSLIILLQVY